MRNYCSILVLLFALSACFADVKDPVGSSDGGTDTDDTSDGTDGSEGSTGDDSDSGTSGGPTSSSETTDTTTEGSTSGAVTDGSTGSTSDGTSGDTSEGSTGTTSDGSGSTTGGGTPEWTECLDTQEETFDWSCDYQCEKKGMACVNECGPTSDKGIQVPNALDPTCQPPYIPGYSTCDQMVSGFLQCCCV